MSVVFGCEEQVEIMRRTTPAGDDKGKAAKAQGSELRVAQGRRDQATATPSQSA
jgi:hypothetical protein